MLKDELVEVWEKSVRSSHNFLTEADVDFYRSRIRETYLQAVELYAIRTTSIVAFMGLSDDMVDMLFVLPTEKGRGYGSALIDFALYEKNRDRVDVNEENTEAYRFYLNRGYQVTGRDQVDSDGRPFPIIHMRHINAISQTCGMQKERR